MDHPRDQLPSSEMPPSGWPGGWYVYEDGQVGGPYTAEEAFALASETTEGQPRLVSRKGFSQWYALRDLSEIFRATAQMGQQAALHEEISEAQLAAGAARNAAATEPRKSVNKVQGRRVEPGLMPTLSTAAHDNLAADEVAFADVADDAPKASDVGHLHAVEDVRHAAAAEAYAADSADEVMAAIEALTAAASTADSRTTVEAAPADVYVPPPPVAAIAAEAVKAKGAAPLLMTNTIKAKSSLVERVSLWPKALKVPGSKFRPKRAKSNGAQTIAAKSSVPQSTPPKSTPPKSTKAPTSRFSSASAASLSPTEMQRNAAMQQYFLARGRLRLGKLRSPWIAALIGVPLTLGGVWLNWFGALAREISMHVRNVEKAALPPTALAIIPGVHIFMVYRLACTLREMEAQNRYHRTSPVLAAVLAAVPPLAMIYLQTCANGHWMLHAQHTGQRPAE